MKLQNNEIKLILIGSNSIMVDTLTKTISGIKLKFFAYFTIEM